MSKLIKYSEAMISRLHDQDNFQPGITAALVRPVQNEFNEILQKVFTRHIHVRWPHFSSLIRTLITGHLHPGTNKINGVFIEETRPAPPPTANI